MTRTTGQKKSHSAFESIANVTVGYVIAVISQMIIFPFFNLHITMRDSIAMGIPFTIISIIRSYTLRRVFNLWHVRGSR